MEEEEKNNIEASIEHLEQYMQSQYELFKLKMLEKTAIFGGALMSSLVTFFTFSLFLLFASIAAAYAISEYTGYSYLGFVCVAGIYLIAFLFMLIKKIQLLRRWLVNFMINKLFEKFDR